ncbi:MAG: DUF805 domain-containing protein [Paracoccaceae bacterium]
MGLLEAAKHCMSHWITFSGRAPRSEYWWFTLFAVLLNLALQIVSGMAMSQGGAIAILALMAAYLLVSIFLGIAGISAAVRRLHDKDRSGWWYWIMLVPVVGVILLLVWFCQRGTQGPNRFGPDPLMGIDAEVFA